MSWLELPEVDAPGRIDGQISLVTGAGSGIGRALCVALAAEGARVVMSDIDRDGLEQTARLLSEEHTAIELDVSDAGAFARVVERITATHGELDLLINNAGTAAAGEVHELGLDHWRRVLDVNLHGVINGVVAAYPGMVARGSGHIVNIASLAGVAPAPLFTPYAASKFAVVGLSRSLRAEAATHGVRVTVVCPGVIETPLLDRRAPNGLAAVASTPDPRSFLTRQIGPPYPSARLATDILRAIKSNRPVLVAPGRARLAWRLDRLLPGATLAFTTHSVRHHQRRLTPT
jgi:NAD(P)-dependent dehydrogenase (short-subunit alcohol dehydrogenase family)